MLFPQSSPPSGHAWSSDAPTRTRTYTPTHTPTLTKPRLHLYVYLLIQEPGTTETGAGAGPTGIGPDFKGDQNARSQLRLAKGGQQGEESERAIAETNVEPLGTGERDSVSP